MDILFIHGNYPGQFLHLASGLASQEQHRVYFLTELEDAAAKAQLPGVKVITYRRHRDVAEQTHPYLRATEQAVLNGQAVVRAIHILQNEGVQPRLIFSHAGNGLGLFIREIAPSAIHISYTEWFFHPEFCQFLLGSSDLDHQLRAKSRNLAVLQELECCDLAVTPTHWQKSQFPTAYHAKINVIFDGVDTSFFKPALHTGTVELQGDEEAHPVVLEPGDLVLSYATRGMEPLRGFPEFMRALPPVLAEFPQLKVVIAGRDRRAYSYDAPSHRGSWKQHLLAELAGVPGLERVIFPGLLNYPHYLALLQRSDLNIYFTRPYVVSWGLLQAAACGTPLLVNHSPAIAEVIPADAALAVDLDQPQQIQAAACQALRARLQQPAVAAPEAFLAPRYRLDTCLLQWQALINSALSQRTASGRLDAVVSSS